MLALFISGLMVMMESYFSSKNNGISFKVSKNKNSDQQTVAFIKLVILSYSDVLLPNFLPQLVTITHSQSRTIVLQRHLESFNRFFSISKVTAMNGSPS